MVGRFPHFVANPPVINDRSLRMSPLKFHECSRYGAIRMTLSLCHYVSQLSKRLFSVLYTATLPTLQAFSYSVFFVQNMINHHSFMFEV